MTIKELPTPCYIVDEGLIEENLKILAGVMERTGARILLAQKAFSMYALYPMIGRYLSGATASGLYEARLGAQEMRAPLEKEGKHCENHVFSPAYKEEEIPEHCKLLNDTVGSPTLATLTAQLTLLTPDPDQSTTLDPGDHACDHILAGTLPGEQWLSLPGTHRVYYEDAPLSDHLPLLVRLRLRLPGYRLRLR